MAFKGAERQLRPGIPAPLEGSGLLPRSAGRDEEDFDSSPPDHSMVTVIVRRSLDLLLGLYFLSHIPITLFFDLQVVLPREFYWAKFRNLLSWYAKEFKDPLMQSTPVWFKSFVFCELLFQLPFFPVATYAFFRGNCKWIRMPAIIYSVHTLTTLIPILSTFLFGDFSKASGFKGQGPETFHERITLVAIYAPYFVFPLILLLFMLKNPFYEEKRKRK
ncbi:Transmembrane protein 97 [Sciurus carolinensis]|nr:Transmembrane protein 97 [Sciurus carolinensis]